MPLLSRRHAADVRGGGRPSQCAERSFWLMVCLQQLPTLWSAAVLCYAVAHFAPACAVVAVAVVLQPPLSPQKCRSPHSPMSPTRRQPSASSLRKVGSSNWSRQQHEQQHQQHAQQQQLIATAACTKALAACTAAATNCDSSIHMCMQQPTQVYSSISTGVLALVWLVVWQCCHLQSWFGKVAWSNSNQFVSRLAVVQLVQLGHCKRNRRAVHRSDWKRAQRESFLSEHRQWLFGLSCG
jgi:hypothetical protein